MVAIFALILFELRLLIGTVFNPGTIAGRRIIAHANQTVISEERYKTYVDRQLVESFSGLLNRESLVCIMHSIPPDLPKEKLKPLLRKLKEKIGTLFLTDLSSEYYHRFSSRFAEFVELILKDV